MARRTDEPTEVLERHLSFSGTAEEFARMPAEVFRELGIPFDKDNRDPREAINERLVRYYVQEGVLSPPDREAHFTYQHLLEFLVARRLISERWTLAMVKQFLLGHSRTELEAALSMNEAERLVRQFAAASALPASEPGHVASSPPSIAARRAPASEPAAARIIRRREIVRFELAPWCHVDVDVNELLRQGSPAIAQRLGGALARHLRDEIFKRGGRK
jgi:DNA-binding transcriptional MerR regulator